MQQNNKRNIQEKQKKTKRWQIFTEKFGHTIKYLYFCRKIHHYMINIIKASEYKAKLKATIQATGRLGFTEETSEKLGFSTQKYIKFAQDDTDNTMFMIVTDVDDKDAFKVCTSGKYYYLATQYLFDALGFDYRNNTIMFDLTHMNELDIELNGIVYKMFKRVNARKMKEENKI